MSENQSRVAVGYQSLSQVLIPGIISRTKVVQVVKGAIAQYQPSVALGGPVARLGVPGKAGVVLPSRSSRALWLTYKSSETVS
jgi:hypothetical protein